MQGSFWRREAENRNDANLVSPARAIRQDKGLVVGAWLVLRSRFGAGEYILVLRRRLRPHDEMRFRLYIARVFDLTISLPSFARLTLTSHKAGLRPLPYFLQVPDDPTPSSTHPRVGP